MVKKGQGAGLNCHFLCIYLLIVDGQCDCLSLNSVVLLKHVNISLYINLSVEMVYSNERTVLTEERVGPNLFLGFGCGKGITLTWQPF